MSIRNIRQIHDELLRKVSREVTAFDERLWQLLDDMQETMYIAKGIGLAGVQVGILKRVIVVDAGKDNNEVLEIINPKILQSYGKQKNQEGCLSCSGIYGVVERPKKILLEYRDRFNCKKNLTAEQLLAVTISHEIDHLNGILFVDKIIN